MDNEPFADTFAAVDLGSNSFHLKIARLVEDKLDIVDRLRDQVQLAAGVDKNKNLTDEAQARALDTLQRFGERLRDLPSGHVRAVGTNTLRRARNARGFLDRAVEALGHDIEIISGQEEARLIYLGVSYMLSDETGRRLVVDIGGGSTECIVGEGFDPMQAASLYMGFDLVGRARHEDIRDRTVEQFVSHYHIDRAQAERVEQTAVDCLNQVEESWELTNPEHRKLLVWAARLHEIGLTISYSGYHRHGEYLIANSEMPGFSRNDQQLLAALVRNHRRKLDRNIFENFRKVNVTQALRLCFLLRLAVVLNRGRGPQSLPPFKLHADENKLEVYFPREWLDEHPLTQADLEAETAMMKKPGIDLWIR